MSSDSTTTRSPVLGLRTVTPPHVVHRQFAEETVVLNVNTGHYHGLNATGGVMLDVLMASPTIEAAVARLVERYEAPADQLEADVLEFVEQLGSRGLITLQPPR